MVGLLALTLITGCTAIETGEATPTDSNEPTGDSPTNGPPDSSETAAPTVEVPDRPKDLSLAGVDPCSLFTAPQLAELGIEGKPKPGKSDDQFHAPLCTLDGPQSEPYYSYDVLVIADLGIDTWLTGRRNVDSWLVSVGGYPGVDFKTKGVEDRDCSTTVDVAEGQQLMVNQFPLSDVDYKQLCQLSEKAATMALQTLQTLK
ncbi:MAG TPA: DUF3558 domain-containing protein [Actinophytocola sp.]|nr:DUF3558 domain-containing protein [Actinophytocola sp.]